MKLQIAIQILELLLVFFRAESPGVAQALADIAEAAQKARQDHLGQPLDPPLIKVETAI